MKYQAYEEYKDSEVEWSNLLPKHWGNVSLRWISEMYTGGTPSKNIEEYWEDGTVPWLNSGAVNQGLVTTASTYITEDAYKNSSAKWIPKNSLVMALAGQGKTKGMVAHLAIDTTCNQSMAAIVPDNLFDSRYLFWWLTFNYQNIRNMAGGDHRDGLNLELLGNIGCPIPSEIEKKIIANFLDHETAKIDTLIEKQQQLIKLLKEKRQAVISHAVTKGLNPNATMRDSGVEWLGEVPEHWDARQLKYLCSYNDEVLSESVGINYEIEYVDIGSVSATDGIKSSEIMLFNKAPSRARRVVRDGDVIVSTVRTYLEAIAPVDNPPNNLIVSTGFAVIRPNVFLHKGYAAYCLRANGFIKEVVAQSVGISYPAINASDLVNIKVPEPKYDEQEQIANFLDQETATVDILIDKQGQQIELMQERRTALISAAVTGKIDVRNWQPADG